MSSPNLTKGQKGLTTESYKQDSESVLIYYLFIFTLYLNDVRYIMAY